MMLAAQLFWEGALFLTAGVLLGYWFFWWKQRKLRAIRVAEEKSLLESTHREAEAIMREVRLAANEEALKLREQTEKSFGTRRRELTDLEQRLAERESLINRQLEGLAQREKDLRDNQQDLEEKKCTVESERNELVWLARLRKEQLQKLSHLSEAEARGLLLKEAEQEALRDATDLTRHILEEAKLKAEEQARRVISLAIQRYAGEHTFETTTATVALQGDDIKGRIIGREGRNIRAFEAATGITVLIDDTPNAVVLSGFDPVRREIAREAMQRLIQDGRIHPTRIEEIVTKVSQEMDETILHLGEEALTKAGLQPMHHEILKLLGRLHFRHSYAQNILDHSIEVAHIMGLLAAELGLDVTAAKRAGLLHDIGKAVNHEIEGPHAVTGAELIKRYGESEVVVNAVASHQ